MKNLKLFFSSLLVLLGICSFNPIQAVDTQMALPVYQNVIEDISLNYEDSMLVGSITLDNQWVLRVVDYKTRDDNIINTWHPGDVVVFDTAFRMGERILSVKRINAPDTDKVEPYVIFDVVESPKTGLRIVEINEEGRFIKLSDDSIWTFSWYHRLSTQRWKAGERVMVRGQGDKNSYEFINLDIPVAENAYTATGSFVIQ